MTDDAKARELLKRCLLFMPCVLDSLQPWATRATLAETDRGARKLREATEAYLAATESTPAAREGTCAKCEEPTGVSHRAGHPFVECNHDGAVCPLKPGACHGLGNYNEEFKSFTFCRWPRSEHPAPDGEEGQ